MFWNYICSMKIRAGARIELFIFAAGFAWPDVSEVIRVVLIGCDK